MTLSTEKEQGPMIAGLFAGRMMSSQGLVRYGTMEIHRAGSRTPELEQVCGMEVTSEPASKGVMLHKS